MPRRIESHFVSGAAGRLEALLEEPEEDEPRFAALVCHPHPQHGGTMHNKVVYRIARGLRKAGAVVLRFNYRGVNLSEGAYDRGKGEADDARVALDWLRERYPRLPYTLAGFSFGSRIVLRLGAEYPNATRAIAAGFPSLHKDWEYVADCIPEKVFIQSTNDQYGPRADFEAFYAAQPEPKSLVWVEAKDHFFVDGLDEFERAVVAAGSAA